ncbi:MAG: cation transporter [Chloroflexota bacterium]|nr:cation transporter [Chloroflexota bacterium]
MPAAAQDQGNGARTPAASATVERLRLALFLTLGTLAIEATGGILSHSLALLADAGHVVTDVFALGLAWFAARQALRPADARRTFGYHRTGILPALLNAVALALIAAFIAFEAYRRLRAPEAVNGAVMLGVAVFGLAMNLVIAGRLSERTRSLNVRTALLHVAGDAAASAGVILAAVIIAATGIYQLDAIISLAIALLICIGTWRIIADTLRILMEGVPVGVNVADMVRQILRVQGIRDVHDLHVWSISSEMTALSCHVLMEDRRTSEIAYTLACVKDMLRERFGVDHATIEVECEGCEPETPFCSQPAESIPASLRRR